MSQLGRLGVRAREGVWVVNQSRLQEAQSEGQIFLF